MCKSIGLLALAVAAGSFVSGQIASGAFIPPPANYVFDTAHSGVTVTQVADVSNPSTNFFLPGATTGQLTQNITGLETFAPVAGGSIASSNSGLQLNNTFTSGGDIHSSSSAAGGVYQITNSNNMAIGLAAGTGAAQYNTTHAYTGATALDIHVTAEWHLNNSFQLPSPPTLFPGLSYQFPIAGFVGINGNDHFIVNLNFTDSAVPGSVGSISIDQDFNNVEGESPLAINQNFSGIVLINHGVALPTNSNLIISGDIVFKAKNEDSPSDFHLGDNKGLVGDNTTGPDAMFGVTNSTDANLPDPFAAPLPASLGMGIVGIGLILLAARRSSLRAKAM